ncbi:P-loop containing nucleoside triphosphate hydrolase protein [Crepidotus variabilis]|uniref:P-loop containing nucleoside triphosphate hydrolase protein n=1 Tax=Crepidotus variabilis TaxID=179855 RepID=A0A9P6EIK0_9AGAR|nr:P-loop containing nucleoside triphosphate hydrolase protein [Crepidotus variabilis]
MESYKSIKDLPTAWLSDVEVSVVGNGNDHPGPRKSGNTVYVYMGTVYQLYNFSKKNSLQVDLLVVDEAGQISLGSISLVLRSLSYEGRIVVAGDSEQLAPILSAQYPLLKAHSLFGSVLDCLMFPRARPLSARPPSPSFDESQGIVPTASPGTIVQLTENFRLNPDLSEFVSTIYSRKFKPQKAQAGELGAALSTVSHLRASDMGLNPEVFGKVQKFLGALSGVMKDRKSTPQSGLIAPEVQLPMTIASPRPGSPTSDLDPISLALIRLRTFPFNISYESHVQAEAAVAAALVASLRKCAPNDDIFVATPHRIQREAVKAALRVTTNPVEGLEDTFGKLRVGEQNKDSKEKVTVDTIERLQGSEASFVICLFSVPKSYSIDLAFLLERRRLNVAISRAKALCILISSDEVLCPSVKVLANEETAKGYAFLKAFQKRAWSFYLQLNADKVAL